MVERKLDTQSVSDMLEINQNLSCEVVWFARKDEIARWVLDHREDTPILDRRPNSTEGLSGGRAN